ncbi:MAG: DUF4345 family protein [Pseudomonadota bacterium]
MGDLSVLYEMNTDFSVGIGRHFSHATAIGNPKIDQLRPVFDKSTRRSICSAMITRIFLFLTALMFAAFGVWSITDPVGMTSQLGVTIGGESGVFEMRGVYGGISLGAAALCLLGGLRDRFEFPALCFIAAYMGGYIVGRGASFVYGDSAGSSNWYFAGYELIMFLISAVLVARKA